MRLFCALCFALLFGCSDGGVLTPNGLRLNLEADSLDGEIQAYTVAGTPYRRIFVYPAGSTERAQIMVRNDYAGQSVYALLFCHGKGGDESNFNVARSKTTRDAFMDDGNWIVIQSNAGGVNWGNQGSIDDYEAAEDYADRSYPIAATAAYGQSMGGTTCLNTVHAGNIENVFALIMISAWTDFRMAWDHPQDYTGGIRTAYFPGLPKTLANYLTYTAGYDPTLLPDSAFAGIAFQMTASPADSATQYANSVNWLDKITPYSPEAQLITVTGPHLSTAHFLPDSVMAFLTRHAPGL